MKKAKIKLSSYDVDGPFLEARERIWDFKEGIIFTGMIQDTVAALRQSEEEYELAILMDDPELALEKRREIEALSKSLVFAAKLLEEENGIDA
tara:strand:+ start:21278 stop:21556 length:279 start_codon:yes stop_codon:yes gene_type:complete